MRRFNKRLTMLAGLAAMGLAGGGLTTSASAATAATAHHHSLPGDAPVTVVAQGLNNPRGLAWGANGHLMVAEAGLPPTECSPSAPSECFGTTGSIADISSGTPNRVVTGLATTSDAGEVIGPQGLVYDNGHLLTLVTKSSFIIPNDLPAPLTATLYKDLGALLDVTDPSSIRSVARPGDYDYVWDQTNKNHPDANPYSVIANPKGGYYLVDAGANLLGAVDKYGKSSVLSYVPPAPNGGDSVPTCIDRAPDGAIYLSELTGVGNSATAANIYKYVPGTGTLSVWQSGFSAVTGCGFGANGDFYVTELFVSGFPPSGSPSGAVVQIAPNGTRTVLGEGKLSFPTGFLAGSDGSIYVSNNSASTGTASTPGQVVKIG